MLSMYCRGRGTSMGSTERPLRNDCPQKWPSHSKCSASRPSDTEMAVSYKPYLQSILLPIRWIKYESPSFNKKKTVVLFSFIFLPYSWRAIPYQTPFITAAVQGNLFRWRRTAACSRYQHTRLSSAGERHTPVQCRRWQPDSSSCWTH